MKTCTCCGEQKHAADFQKRAASKDGLTASCRQCLKARDAARYPKERTHRLEAHKAYTKTERGSAASSDAKRRWIEANPRERSAQLALGRAVRSGRVKPWPVCFVPECDRKSEAHHPDYDAPLAVVWLCPCHHKQVHAQQRKMEAST